MKNSMNHISLSYHVRRMLDCLRALRHMLTCMRHASSHLVFSCEVNHKHWSP